MRVRLLLTLAVALSVSASVASTRDLFRTNAALWQTPQAASVKSFTHDGVRAVMIDGEPWRGRPTRFFAYYGLPSNATAAAKAPDRKSVV